MLRYPAFCSESSELLQVKLRTLIIIITIVRYRLEYSPYNHDHTYDPDTEEDKEQVIIIAAQNLSRPRVWKCVYNTPFMRDSEPLS